MNKSTVLSSKFFEKLECNFVKYTDKVAISYNGDERQITYKELNEISARVHGYLKAKDLMPDDFVMIKLPRGAEAGAVAIGVLRAGVAYTIVEEGYPQERVDFIYKDCSCKLCIDSAAYEEILNTEPVYGFEKTDDHKAAFAIYTSGTTGTPKGVLIERGVLDSSIHEIFNKRDIIFSNNDKFACISPLSFVALEIFMLPILYAGGEFDVVATEVVKSPDAFCRFIAEHSINTAFLPPSLLRLFSEFPKSITRLYTGSEPVRNVFIENVSIMSIYAQSETGSITSVFKIDKPYELTPAGKSCEKIKLLDESGKEAEAGELGEICFANQYFRGYINRPEETERAFRGGIYHTGDLGRLLEDGSIVIAGRVDDMVKINGNRVEPAEIEEVVKNAFGINWAAAKVVDKNGHKSVCAYYVDEPKTDIEEAKKIIASKLPAYMVPANYMQIVKMPLNANGKFSRRLLPDPQEQAGNYKNPQTDLEQKLFNLVSENINTVSFGTDTNLVALGLDSIAVMKLCRDIAEKLGKEISFADVMKQPTVAGIASVLENSRKNKIVSYPVQKYYPLTESQRGIFINWELDNETTQYNIPFYYSFRDFDAVKLADAARKAVENHCHLKMRLELVNGEPMQKRCDDEKVIIGEFKLDAKPDSDFFRKLVKPFDLFKEPLYRINVYSYGSSVYLFMDFHHIVFDGLSVQLLINDIISAYNGKELPSEKINAYDFALYQKDFEKSEEYKSAEKYFDEILGDAEPARFTAYSKPDGKNYGKLTKRFSSADIFDYCRRNGVTASSFMHAVFAETIHRITRENEFLYTTVSNGRSADNALQNCTGMFVQTLPVVFNSYQLSATSIQSPTPGSDSALNHAEQRVSDYIHSVHEQLQKSFENECYPYTKFSERHKINTEITFLYQGGILGNSALTDGNSIEIFTLDPDKPVFPVNMLVYPVGDDFELRLEYDGMKYSSHDMQILAEAVVNAAISMISAEHVKDISLVSDEQKEQIIKLSAGEKLEYDRTQTWIDLFKKQLAAHPENLAVADNTSSLTYAELNRQSDSVAAYLMNNGVKPNDFVALKMDRVKEFVVAVLGIHKAGAAYVPIDIHYPQERIDYILSNSMAKFTITEKAVAEAVEQNPDAKPVCLAKPDNYAYMIYTSGSTGLPKGALLHQRGLMNFTVATIKLNELTKDDRISCYRSFSFDAHIEDVFPVLATGASVHIMPEAIRKDPDSIYNFLMEHQITGGGYTTSIAKLMLTDYKLKQRFITCGGEALTNVISDKVQILNVYGPTECTDHISVMKLEKNRKYSTIPIGKPMANGYCFVVDKYNNLVPAGAAGELCYAGPQVGYGYWHLDEKTKEVFGDCPFVDGIRMYHTGDLARYNEEGNIEYLGRIDFQVKLRGFRIELGEVESRASQYKGVKQVIALVKNVGASQNLCLYFTAETEVNKETLRSFMAETLTEYMVPTVFMQLETMPLTPNGKIDRKKLPEPILEVAEVVAPETETEKKLFAVATEILGFDKFGVTTSLISAGMTSLAAMRFSAAAKQKAGLKVKVADIMKLQTIRAIAANMENGEDLGIVLKAYEKRELYPITENQRGIYVDWEMNRETTQYNIPKVYRFEDKDAEKLADAVRKTVDAHCYLKTRFVNENGDIMQKPMWEEPAEVTVQTLDTEPDSAFFQKLVKPFNLFEDRLYRIAIYKFSKTVYLFTDIHHTVFDGLSDSIFLSDILAAYNGKVPELEKLTAFDFALYEKEVAASEMFSKAEAYFEKLTGDSNTAVYPDAKKADGIKNGKVAVKIPMEAIDRFCSENGVTVNAYMHAAFAETLHRFTREENPLYLTISNGRSDAEALQNSVGMFVKTLPVVMQTEGLKHGDETVAVYVKRMYQHLQDLYAYDFYPYTRIVEKSGIHAEIMFVYQGGIEGYSSEDVNSILLNLDTGKFPVDVTVYPEGGKYCLIVEYDGNRYEQGNMREFAEAIAAVAENMASEKLVKDIRLLGKDETERVLQLSKGETLEYDRNQTWVELFRKQAEAHPEHIAVADSTSSMTYAELDRQSDSVARYLTEAGARPENFVAVKMGRIKEFIVAVLGIHKSGAAYLPIDSDCPEERVKYMLEDSGATMLLDDEAVKKAINHESSTVLSYKAQPENLAYMIYTSGSTGKPKGVMIQHRAMLNFLHFIRSRWGLTSESRICCHSNFAFDAAVEDLYPVLTAGGTLFIVPDEARMDIGIMRKFLENNKIRGGCYTTQFGQLLALEEPLDVDYICLGGEKMVSVPKTDGHVYNTYGPTEFTVDATYFELEKNKEYADIPIGRALHNCYAIVTDKYGQMLPYGIAGELCLAGPQIAKGYWKRPDLTSEKFAPLPGILNGQLAYRTGDLARYNEDGYLEYLGRIDFQVKLRGFRIELGEVENRASQFEGVKQVIALVKNVGSNQNLCLYFTAETQVDKEALRSFMAQTLTDFMVPTVFMQLDKMPMTPNGKINRKALPEPVIEREKGREPATELETKICEIFAETLGINKVYADESFFDIGGSSISAMKVVMKAMNKGIKFVYSNIFDNPTPEALARFIENGAGSKTVSDHGSEETYAPKEEPCYEALKYNTMEYLEDVSSSDIGKVLVTGANGFLGIHVVKNLLDKGCPVVYCLIRNGRNMSAEARLDMMFMYYFDETYSEMIGSRIRIINGDITDKSLEETLKEVDYDTVINCAAVVKHFSNDDILDRVNFHGVENLVEICCKHNKKLVQVSTVSIAGKSIDNCVPMDFLMHENQHSFGQSLDSKYGRTKWLAEKAVLEAVQNRGLRGKIIRVGNLMSRASDGEFQANFRTNNFMNTLKAYNTLGCLPMANIVEPTEFSPIDSTAEAVITLAGTPDKFTVFHADNNHTVDMANVIDAMNACGLDIKIVKQAEFQKRFDEVMHDEKRNASISSLIAYLGNDSSRRFIASNNTFTLAVLNVLGFRWPIITEEYIEKAIKALKSMDFFD